MEKLQNYFDENKKTNDPAALSARIDTVSTESANLKSSIAENAAMSSLLLSMWSSLKLKPDAADSENAQKRFFSNPIPKILGSSTKSLRVLRVTNFNPKLSHLI